MREETESEGARRQMLSSQEPLKPHIWDAPRPQLCTFSPANLSSGTAVVSSNWDWSPSGLPGSIAGCGAELPEAQHLSPRSHEHGQTTAPHFPFPSSQSQQVSPGGTHQDAFTSSHWKFSFGKADLKHWLSDWHSCVQPLFLWQGCGCSPAN